MQKYKKIVKCHKEGQLILNLGSATIHASGNTHDYTGYSLIINISNYSYTDGEVAYGVHGAAKMMQGFIGALPAPKAGIPELVITWPDGNVPALTKSDWGRLIDDLSRVQGKVLVHCMGGHGRTGTALAVLLALSGALKKDPVKWLRKNYCEKVVETKAQFDYLKSLGIQTSCEVEKRPLPVTQYYDGNAHWFRNNWKQEEYNLTKPSTTNVPPIDDTKELQQIYTCILCCRKHIAASFYQTFMDGTGFCWQCHQLTHKTNPDTIQSA